jgi:hypothetical protein
VGNFEGISLKVAIVTSRPAAYDCWKMSGPTSSVREDVRKIAPLLIAGGLCLFAAPLFHPNNTCADWLQKWGQLSALRIWIPIHQVASLGFALGAVALLLLALVGPRTAAGLTGGGAAAAGFGMMSLTALIHATSVSTIGAAYNSAATQAQRDSLKVIANAFVSYDVAVDGVAVLLMSGGLVLLAWYLYRISAVSSVLAFVLAADGSIEAVQYYRVLHLIHYSFPEWVPYTSVGLWLCAAGILVLLRQPAARALTKEAAVTA